MKIILSGGGTAGHINPAIAIADKFMQKYPDTEILFVGSTRGMENTLVTLAGYPIWQLDVVGIKRSLSLSNLKAAYKTVKSVSQAKKIIERFSPDAVIGTGGYVCYPILKAASQKGVYTALHESNSVPGLAVKMLKNKVDRVFVGFDSCADILKVREKCLWVGNPIKSDFSDIDKDKARKELNIGKKYRYVLVSFGGSLGAETVNKAALNIMDKIVSKRGDILHIHSCGKNGAGKFFEEFKNLGLNECSDIRVSEYINNMPTYLKAADAVMCRSGAMTLSEIAASGLPSILIPSPNVTGNHQYKNALEFSSANAAFAIDEKNENVPEKALQYVNALLTNETLRQEMSANALKFANDDCAGRIVEDIVQSIKKKELI